MKGKITFILIGLIIVAGIVAAVLIVTSNNAKKAAAIAATATAEFTLNGPCGIETIKAAGEDIKSILSRWLDAEEIASRTGRIALSGPVSNLQTIRRDLDDLKTPDCMQTVIYDYGKAMDASIQSYLAFMSQESDTVVSGYFKSAANYMSLGSDALQAVYACAPNCP